MLVRFVSLFIFVLPILISSCTEELGLESLRFSCESKPCAAGYECVESGTVGKVCVRLGSSLDTSTQDTSTQDTSTQDTSSDVVEPDIGEYVTIPSGSFTMGSPAGELGRGSDEVEHAVTLTRSFEMKTTEVTQGEWESLMGNNPSEFSSCGASCPVEQVNWYEALAYANALSTAKGLAACYTLTACTSTAGTGMTCKGVTVTGAGKDPYACTGYRLPTEAEWEYAYRSGTTSAFYNGNIADPNCSDPNLEVIGWYCGNAVEPHPVGQKQANIWGLYDMSGNVWEWCWDLYGTYPGTVSNPVGAATGLRVYRGGSWNDVARFARAAFRDDWAPSTRNTYLGFRLSRSRP